MAGHKKKRKAAVNPARGFATTSIASKSKDKISEGVRTDKSEDAIASDVKDVQLSEQERRNEGSKESASTVPSPEEYEKQLEDAELQAFVDNNGLRIRKDAKRFATRLRTERRLLKERGEYINTTQWISSKILDDIINLIRLELARNDIPNASNACLSKGPDEDELLIRAWTLQLTLMNLGFGKSITNEALARVLGNPKNILKAASPAKDGVWCLEEALDWLTIECPDDEQPDEDGRGLKAGKCLDVQEASNLEFDMSEGSEESSESKHINNGNNQQDRRIKAESLSNDDIELDPEELIPTYVSTMSRLFEIAPDILDNKRGSKKSHKKTQKQSSDDKLFEQNLEIKRLQHILGVIKNDVLFDESEAEFQWAERRNFLSKLYKETNRRSMLEPENSISEKEKDAHSDDKTDITIDVQESTDEDAGLGNLFESTDETSPAAIRDGDESADIKIQDFGKFSGISPRKLLEDYCKTRDTLCKIEYKLLSQTAFSFRHSIQITWSKLPESRADISFIPEIECTTRDEAVIIAMTKIATPTRVQSEAYVSVVALFHFTGSDIEEKNHLHLPSTWRDVWAELAVKKQELDDEMNKDNLRWIRSLVNNTASSSRDVRTDKPPENVENVGTSVGSRKRQAYNRLHHLQPKQLRDLWFSKILTTAFKTMTEFRSHLPIWDYKVEILKAVEDHQVVIVCGETGSGKSTQTPRFILENELSNGRDCQIYCLQPRRISAMSLAYRVSEELGEKRSEFGTSSLVGYAIRLETKISAQTRIVYATNGVLLKMLETSPELDNITHVILDEIHERSIETDFLLIVLRRLVDRRPDLKLILMSATVDARRFSEYLDGAPIVNVPGRTFPVKAKYLEDVLELTDYTPDSGTAQSQKAMDSEDLETEEEPSLSDDVEHTSTKGLKNYSAKTLETLSLMNEYRINYDVMILLLEKIATHPNLTQYSSAILVFLPGIAEIRRLHSLLVSNDIFSADWCIYPMHSSISTEEQARAFLPPPKGMRKLVLATNIAETGITIPDVTCVVDTGKHKEIRFDERRQLSRLLEVFTSRANAIQRRGRAGRVQPGVCFHLFTRERFEKYFSAQQTPEMLRLSLQELILKIKICKLGDIEDVLMQALDSPSPKSIRRTIVTLMQIGALDGTEELTPLGLQLSHLPVDFFLGKMIILGIIFQCLDASLTIAAILSSKSPFLSPFDAKAQADAARISFRKGDSDLLTAYNAYCAWRQACLNKSFGYFQLHRYCKRNFLNAQSLSSIEDLKGQLLSSAVDAGLVVLTEDEQFCLRRARGPQGQRRQFVECPKRMNTYSTNVQIVNSVLASSLYPQLLRHEGKHKWQSIVNNSAIKVHPTSVVHCAESLPKWLSYYYIMQSSSKLYNAYEANAVEDFAVAMLCGEAQARVYGQGLVIDSNRIRFITKDRKTALAMKYLRKHLEDVVASFYVNPRPCTDAWLELWQRACVERAASSRE